MPSRLLRSWRAVAFAALVGACGTDPATPSPSDGVLPTDAALRFEQSSPVRINPGTRFSLTLLGPASDETTRVWLDGDYLDASLDHGIVDLSSGRADVVLTAPSASTNFDIRARQGALTARFAVSVSPEGSATLRVHPQYDGVRPAPSFVVGVFANHTCAELTDHDLPAVDGSPSVEGAPGSTLVLSNVPAGVQLALLARVLHYAAGCKEFTNIEADSTRDVDLPVYRRDLELGGAFHTDVTLEPNATELAAWRAGFAPLQSGWVDAFVPPATDEATWLLDAMRDVAAAQAAANAAEFTTKRTSGGWNGKTATWLAAHTPTVRARATALVGAGLSSPPSPLGLVIEPGDPTDQRRNAAVASLAGRANVTEWMAAPVPFNWSADAADVLRLEGTITLAPGSFVSFAADVASSPSPDLAAGLAQGIDCGGLAQTLVGAGVSYTGCDLACTADACRAALRLRAREASSALDAAHALLSLGINGTAKPEISERAEVKSFAGSWSGTVTVTAGATPFGTHGNLRGGPEP